jgi:predicted porin
MRPRLHLFIILCLSASAAFAETAVSPADSGSEPITNGVQDNIDDTEQESTRRKVMSEEEDPQAEITRQRKQEAEEFGLPQEVAREKVEDDQDGEQMREEIRSEEEEPRFEREMEPVQPYIEASYKGDVYGSLRLRYRSTDAGSILGDAGSRVGFEGEFRAASDSWAYARVEAGFNVLDELDTLLSPGGSAGESQQGDSLFPRLYLVGIETPVIVASYGKNWSTYYKIANFTDRFDSAGGNATGTYNANTDGGATGTGRADAVLQSLVYIDFMPKRWRVNPFNLNIQFQSSQPIPGVEDVSYQYAFGLSAVIDSTEDYTLGLAYNRAKVGELDNAAVQAAGIKDDAEAYLLGVRWFDDSRYIGFTLARLLNHETTDEGTYFEGWGTELYARYRLIKSYWLVAGYNWLFPDSDQIQVGEFELLYGIVGLRYSIDEFNRLAYAEWRLDSTTTENGDNLGNIFTIGVRWDF